MSTEPKSAAIRQRLIHRSVRAAERGIGVAAPNLALRLRRKRAYHPLMRREQSANPCSGCARAGQFHHQLGEDSEILLIAAICAGLYKLVESKLAELGHGLSWNASRALAFRGSRPDARQQRTN